MTPRKVFISSKIKEKERDVVFSVIDALRERENIPFVPWLWEKDSKTIPSGKSPEEVQSKHLKESDIYLLILGAEYGSEEVISPTQKEYAQAYLDFDDKDCILIYVKNDEDTVQKRDKRLKSWIEDIRKTHSYKPFENAEELKGFVGDRLRYLWHEKFEKSVPKMGSGLYKSDRRPDGSDMSKLVETLHKIRR